MGYDWTKITVSDNGIGFEQSFAEKIFAPFQRLHGRSEYKGTGIGLAVCRRIVERHNGQITAVSSPGKGATFSIIIPKRPGPCCHPCCRRCLCWSWTLCCELCWNRPCRIKS